MIKINKGLIFFSLILLTYLYINGQWARRVSEAGSEFPRAIFTTGDGSIFSTGHTEANAKNGYSWILKLSPEGEKSGAQSYKIGWDTPDSKDEILGVYHDGEGQFIFAGNTEAYPKYENAATKRMMVYKVSFDGDILWSKVIGGELSSSAAAVYGTLDGGCIASGYFYSLSSGAKDVILVKLDSFGMIEWQKSYGEKGNDVPMAVFPANDGGYVFAGNSYSFYPFNGDYWVVKLSAWGDVEWEKTYGRKLEDNAYCADITPDGGFIIAGESFSVDSENSDIWIVRLSASGNILWQKAYTQGERSRANSIVALPEGGYAVAGTSWEQKRQELIYFKITDKGDIIWQKKFSVFLSNEEISNDSACGIAQSVDGSYAVLGLTESTLKSDKYVMIIKTLSNGDLSSCGYLSEGSLSVVDTNVVPLESEAEVKISYFIEYDADVMPASSNFDIQILCPSKKNIIRR